MASLAEQTNILTDAGFSQKEIEDWKKDKVIKLNSAGFVKRILIINILNNMILILTTI